MGNFHCYVCLPEGNFLGHPRVFLPKITRPAFPVGDVFIPLPDIAARSLPLRLLEDVFFLLEENYSHEEHLLGGSSQLVSS